MHFFDISISKSDPSMVCFVHFDFEMCFAPQQRALFRHLNFQEVRAWCALFILTSKRASRHNGVRFFNISTSKSAPDVRYFQHLLRATGVQLFIFHHSSLISPDSSAPAALASLLFDPQEPQNIGKTQCFATFLPCEHLHLLSSDSFSSLIFFLPIFFLLLFFSLLRLFPPLLFHLSILSEIGLLSIYLSI